MAFRHACVPEITGSTDVYLIVGDPVEQVRAPQAFNHVFAQMGIDAVLVPAQVAPQDLAGFVRAAFSVRNIKGLWVTIPHKSAIIEMLDDCCPLAQAAGAVNAVRRTAHGRIEGDLFDGRGFLASLDRDAIAHVGRKVLVLGAGGAAAAIGASLLLDTAGPVAELSFYDPAPGRARDVATRLAAIGRAGVHAVDNNDPCGFDLVINATPLGLNLNDPLPCDVSRMDSHAALADILMKNQPTPLVRAARSRGLVAQTGYDMMILQAHLYLDFFGFSGAAEMVRQDASSIRRIFDPV